MGITKKVVALAISAALVLMVATTAVILYGSDGSTEDQDTVGNDGSDEIDSTDDDSNTGDTEENVPTNSSEDGVNATIELGTEVMVDGSTISTDPSSPVYLSSSSLGYSIVNIARAGTYIISGTFDPYNLCTAFTVTSAGTQQTSVQGRS